MKAANTTRHTTAAVGVEWLIEAFGCAEDGLRDRERLSALFRTIVRRMALCPVGEPVWHVFPGGGGATGIWLLQESHLAIHTFPEYLSACVNVFCCTPRPALDWPVLFFDALGANDVRVRQCERVYERLS